MTEEPNIKEKLLQLHRQEDSANKLIGDWDKKIANYKKQIVVLESRKKKVAKYISGNMKYRNQLINQL